MCQHPPLQQCIKSVRLCPRRPGQSSVHRTGSRELPVSRKICVRVNPHLKSTIVEAVRLLEDPATETQRCRSPSRPRPGREMLGRGRGLPLMHVDSALMPDKRSQRRVEWPFALVGRCVCEVDSRRHDHDCNRRRPREVSQSLSPLEAAKGRSTVASTGMCTCSTGLSIGLL